MTSTDNALESAVKAMNAGACYDVTIVCTTDDYQAAYWMEKLSINIKKQNTKESTQDSSSSPYPIVLAVSEDWNDNAGAGNGLGTLYAFQKAQRLAQNLYNISLAEDLQLNKIAAALYHTAGKGTRLAPLPASENNNKPGVKLPFYTSTQSSSTSYTQQLSSSLSSSLTVLEAVVKQTAVYAQSRLGRLSVYWGDQIFIPSASFSYAPTHHADIMCTFLGDTTPTEQEWKDLGLDKYGVIACVEKEDNNNNNSGRIDAAQVEKVSHATAMEMLTSLGRVRQVGPSLGSFSISAALLQALMNEFETELIAKTSKLDTDPHFWMPLTLSQESYIMLMQQKGVNENESTSHYQRMTRLKNNFDLGTLGLFGAVDVGKDACWWDYGLLKLYSTNTLVLLEDSKSSNLLKQFLGIQSHQVDCQLDGVNVDEISYAFNSRAKSGIVKQSLLAGVATKEINANGAIIVNCAAQKIHAGPGAILYNLIDDSDDGIIAGPGEVMVAVTNEAGESMVLKSHMDIDGGKVWKERLDMNDMSFEEVHAKNKNANIQEIQKKRQGNYKKVVDIYGL